MEQYQRKAIRHRLTVLWIQYLTMNLCVYWFRIQMNLK